MSAPLKNWVVVEFDRTVLMPMAQVLSKLGRLRLYVQAAGRKPKWDRGETFLLRSLMAMHVLAARVIHTSRGQENMRNRLHYPLDWLATRLIRRGDNILSSNNFAVSAFRKVRKLGGLCVYDAGSAHTAEHQRLWEEQYALWKPTCGDMVPSYFSRSIEMIDLSDYITVPCSYVRQTFLDRGWERERLLDLPYGVDLTNFFPEPRADDGIFKVVHTGTLCLRKGFPYMCEGFARFHAKYPNTELHLRRSILDVGHIIGKYEHFMRWIEWVPFDRLRDTYNNADAFIMPSIEEGYARTIVEAMACGIPVIATARTVAPDLYEDGKGGIIIPPGDSDAIFRALCWLYENRDAARAMGEAGRQAVAKVRDQNFEAQWTHYIENQLSAPRPPLRTRA